MSHPDYVADMIRDAYAAEISDRLKVIRERLTDIVALAAPSGDARTVRAMDDMFLILNNLEAAE